MAICIDFAGITVYFEETAYYLKLTAERFPYIKERMMESFPDLIREAVINEHEFY